MEVGFEDHGIEERFLFLDFATDGHDAHIGKGMELVDNTIFNEDEVILVEMIGLAIERYVQVALKDEESLLHIGMDMGKHYFRGTEIGDGYL